MNKSQVTNVIDFHENLWGGGQVAYGLMPEFWNFSFLKGFIELILGQSGFMSNQVRSETLFFGRIFSMTLPLI